MAKKWLRTLNYILIPVIFTLIGWFGHTLYLLPKDSNKLTETISLVKPTPLLKYTVENLSKTNFEVSEIKIGDILEETDEYTKYKYSMEFNPDLSESTKTVSGVINIPKGSGPFPIIVMFRGFASQETYVMGTGTQPSARVFASEGFITIAPDFLGYGESSKEASDIFETRFQTYVTAIATLKSIEALKDQPLKAGSNNITVDTDNIFIWGHSNGGQIALTALEIAGVDYPTVLWAPVSMRFPASILYYIDEAEDGGKYLIGEVNKFLEVYDAEKYSLLNYLANIKAPIQLNQGTADTAVPYWQSDGLNKKLEGEEILVEYIKYSGADHNMRPRWDEVVSNNLLFFNSHLK